MVNSLADVAFSPLTLPLTMVHVAVFRSADRQLLFETGVQRAPHAVIPLYFV